MKRELVRNDGIRSCDTVSLGSDSLLRIRWNIFADLETDEVLLLLPVADHAGPAP